MRRALCGLSAVLAVLGLAALLTTGPAGANPLTGGGAGAGGPTGPTGATGPGVSGLTTPALSYATSATTLGDSGVFWDTANGCRQLVLPLYSAVGQEAAIAALQCSINGDDGLTIANTNLANISTLWTTDGDFFVTYASSGTFASPLPLAANALLFNQAWHAWDGTQYSNAGNFAVTQQQAADVSPATSIALYPENASGLSSMALGNSGVALSDTWSFGPRNPAHAHEMVLGWTVNGHGDGVNQWLGVGVSTTAEHEITAGVDTVNATIKHTPAGAHTGGVICVVDGAGTYGHCTGVVGAGGTCTCVAN